MRVKAKQRLFFSIIIFSLSFFISILDLWAGVSIFEISVKTEKYKNGRLLSVPTTSATVKLVEDNYGKFVARVKGEQIGIFVADDLTPFQTFWIKEDALENLPEARMDITVRCKSTKEGLINLNGVVEKNEFLDRGGEDERAYKYNWDRIDTTFHEGEQKVLRLYDDGKGTVYFLRLQAKVIGEIKEVEKCLAVSMEYRAKRLDTGQGLCRVNNGVCILPNSDKGESLKWSCGAKGYPEADQAKETSLDFEGSISADFVSTDEIKVKLKLKRSLAFPYEGNGGRTVLRTDSIVKEFALAKDQAVEIELPDVPENFPFELNESLVFTYKGETTKK